jgi:hypothetical protein
MKPEPVLIITERAPVLTPAESYRATCISHEWRWDNRRLVLIFELDDDEGRLGTIRKWLTVRDRLSPDTKLGQLYSQILNRPLELGDRLDPSKFHGCVFLVTVGWNGKVGRRWDAKNMLRKKGAKDFLRIHDLKFIDFDASRASYTASARRGTGLDPLVPLSQAPQIREVFEQHYFSRKLN